MRFRGARIWCSHCCEDIEVLSTSGWDSCSYCGKVLDCPISKSHRMMGKLQKFQVLRAATSEIKHKNEAAIAALLMSYKVLYYNWLFELRLKIQVVGSQEGGFWER